MNKRIRKKIAKRAAEHEEPLPPRAALQHAVEELKDSAVHLFDTALHELQQSTSLLVSELRMKALGVIDYVTHNIVGTARPAERVRHRPVDRAAA